MRELNQVNAFKVQDKIVIVESLKNDINDNSRRKFTVVTMRDLPDGYRLYNRVFTKQTSLSDSDEAIELVEQITNGRK